MRSRRARQPRRTAPLLDPLGEAVTADEASGHAVDDLGSREGARLRVSAWRGFGGECRVFPARRVGGGEPAVGDGGGVGRRGRVRHRGRRAVRRGRHGRSRATAPRGETETGASASGSSIATTRRRDERELSPFMEISSHADIHDPRQLSPTDRRRNARRIRGTSDGKTRTSLEFPSDPKECERCPDPWRYQRSPLCRVLCLGTLPHLLRRTDAAAGEGEQVMAHHPDVAAGSILPGRIRRTGPRRAVAAPDPPAGRTIRVTQAARAVGAAEMGRGAGAA